jgi:hypothetical protein
MQILKGTRVSWRRSKVGCSVFLVSSEGDWRIDIDFHVEDALAWEMELETEETMSWSGINICIFYSLSMNWTR